MPNSPSRVSIRNFARCGLISAVPAFALFGYLVFLHNSRPHIATGIYSHNYLALERGSAFYLSTSDITIFFALLAWVAISVIGCNIYLFLSLRKKPS